MGLPSRLLPYSSIGHARARSTRSRLPAARALFAGVAILAGAFAPAAQASGNDETAMAVPRIALPDGNAGVALPQPLSPSDAVLVASRLPLAGSRRPARRRPRHRRTAERPLARASAGGARPGAVPSGDADELTDWLGRYASQPDAPGDARPAAAPAAEGCRPLPAASGHRAATPLRRYRPRADRRHRTPPSPGDAAGRRSAAAGAGTLPGRPAATRRCASCAPLIDTRRDLTPAYAALLRGEIVRAPVRAKRRRRGAASRAAGPGRDAARPGRGSGSLSAVSRPGASII